MSNATHGMTERLWGDAEDRRKHLEFIQATITRMAAASTTTKSWMLPVVTATYGYALTRNADSLAALGICAVALFAFLDANYLRAERRFRGLYEAVVAGDERVGIYSLSPFDAAHDRQGGLVDQWPKWLPSWFHNVIPGPRIWQSWAVGPFYGSFAIVGIVICVRVAL